MSPQPEAPQRPRSAPIELAVLDQPTAAPIPVLESSVPVSLPPPPVIVGKLSSATASAAEPTRFRAQIASAPAFAEPPTATPEPTRTPRSSGFGDASIAAASQRAAVSSVPKTAAVEILSKPRPLYTEEARRLRIEGEVLLEVLFTASGTAQVARVIRGLGHGLDESAVASVAALRFRPAQQAGQPVDQTATIQITFQLAY